MTTSSQNHAAVTAVLNHYFDGLYDCDAHLLGTVFHAKGQLATVSDGDLVLVDVPTWLDAVAKRESPARRGEARIDRIVSVEFGSESTALARVQCAIGPKLFTDFLSLLRIGNDWKVISKTYQFEPLK